jgi:hypothetical protein
MKERHAATSSEGDETTHVQPDSEETDNPVRLREKVIGGDYAAHRGCSFASTNAEAVPTEAIR